MFVGIKQHLSNIWGSIRETFRQHLDWVEKKLVIYFSEVPYMAGGKMRRKRRTQKIAKRFALYENAIIISVSLK